KGDVKEKSIALASICAKVTRDRHMRKQAKKYPQYGFDVHKGYGTRRHYEMIKQHGLLGLHRRSFLRDY
ncbi:ribonuclease HII, partial [bacterium]|nr:ribonuclease HII [bacterium]